MLNVLRNNRTIRYPKISLCIGLYGEGPVITVRRLLIYFLVFAGVCGYADAPLHRLNEINPKSFTTWRVNSSVDPVTGHYCEEQCDLSLPGAYALSIIRAYSKGSALDDAVALAPGWYLIVGPDVDRVYDSLGALTELRRLSPDSKRVVSWVKLHWNQTVGNQSELWLEGCDGSECRYYFDSQLLTRVILPGGRTLRYHYSHDVDLAAYQLVRREDDRGSFLVNEYEQGTGRVMRQWAPVGNDETPVVVTRLLYGPGYTEVFDAAGGKVVYRSSNGHVEAIETYAGETIYRIERFYWKQDQLVSYALIHADGSARACRTFAYDASGNRVHTAFYGDLSGDGPKSFPLNGYGQPIGSSVESYGIRYCYSKDTHHLPVAVFDDSGKAVTMVYDPCTHLLEAQYLWDGSAIQQRFFCRYDDTGFLVETIADDGYNQDRQDLSGVTERRIVTIVPKAQAPAAGLPVLTDEKYWDGESGIERLLRTTISTYDSSGRLQREEFFNGDAENVGYLDYGYDTAGKLCAKVDGAGTLQTYDYHPQGVQQAVISADGSKSGRSSYCYDLAGRLLVKKMQDSEGRVFTSSFRYNTLGQMVASVDLYGNETRSAYDALGRCVSTCYPEVLTATDSRHQPEVRREYDSLDCAIVSTDANGYTTRAGYNVRGQPIWIDHPDGTYERFVYNLDGSVRMHLNRLGVTSHYDRDSMSRVTRKQLIGRDGENIAIQAHYDSFHLLGTVDARGTQTCFSYDGAGRLFSVISLSSDGDSQKEFSYDANGALAEAREWFGAGASDFSRLVIGHDPESKRVSAHIADASEQSLVSNEYLSPPHSTPEVHFDTTHCNELGQRVLQKTTTDRLGTQTVTTYDALGRIASIEHRNTLGSLLARCEMRYDAVGNRVLERTMRLGAADDQNGAYVTQRTFGPMKRVESVVEALGTPQETRTVYIYGPTGQLERTGKPSGCYLEYAYDGFGRLSLLSASDGTVGYGYSYDENNQPIIIENLVTGSATRRKYDAAGRVVFEQLENGLFVDRSYDGKGRCTKLELPDGTGVEYRYDAARLCSIHRLDASGQERYAHTYSRFSATGDVEEVDLVGGLGRVSYERDAQGRRTAISSDYWSERIPEEGYDAVGHITCIDITDPTGPYRMCFAYDGLGQLIAENGVSVLSYSYDALRNRRAKGLAEYEINRSHQLLSTVSAQYRYDANGNRITKETDKGLVRYQYDALDRLMAVEEPARQRIEYLYDASHRRMAKTLFVWDTKAGCWSVESDQRYLFDGRHEIGAADGNGALQQLRVLGPGIAAEVGAAVALELQGIVYAPLHDHRGSLVCLVDMNSRRVVEYSRMTAFGEEQLYNSAGESIPADLACNPWRFSSKRCERETGLVFYGRRYYDPEIGRWMTKDPLGDVDGVNDYAFVCNSPENLVDAEGLFSLDISWDSFLDSAWNYLNTAASLSYQLFELLRRDLRVISDISDQSIHTGHQLIGPRIWDVIGFYAADPESGVIGQGEISDRLRFSHVNGIQNTREICLSTVKMISDLHGGANIHYTYRPTAGWTWDFLNACIVKFGIISPTAHVLADQWRDLIKDIGGTQGGGVIVHYAHSLGGAESDCARYLLTPEEQGMIRVFTFGSPALLPSEGFQAVTNYVSRLDPVCLFDPVRYLEGFLGADANILFVGTYWGIPILDHLLVSDSYRQVLQELGRYYTSGQYQPAA